MNKELNKYSEEFRYLSRVLETGSSIRERGCREEQSNTDRSLTFVFFSFLAGIRLGFTTWSFTPSQVTILEF